MIWRRWIISFLQIQILVFADVMTGSLERNLSVWDEEEEGTGVDEASLPRVHGGWPGGWALGTSLYFLSIFVYV